MAERIRFVENTAPRCSRAALALPSARRYKFHLSAADRRRLLRRQCIGPRRTAFPSSRLLLYNLCRIHAPADTAGILSQRQRRSVAPDQAGVSRQWLPGRILGLEGSEQRAN